MGERVGGRESACAGAIAGQGARAYGMSALALGGKGGKGTRSCAGGFRKRGRPMSKRGLSMCWHFQHGVLLAEIVHMRKQVCRLIDLVYGKRGLPIRKCVGNVKGFCVSLWRPHTSLWVQLICEFETFPGSELCVQIGPGSQKYLDC